MQQSSPYGQPQVQMPQPGQPFPPQAEAQPRAYHHHHQHAMPMSAAIIDNRYCIGAPTQLILQEQYSFSGDDFTAYDHSGRLWFKIDAAAFSWSQRRTLIDCYGMPVACISRKHMSLHGTWNLYRGDGSQLLCTIKPPIMSLRPKIKVYLGGRDDGEPEYVAYGNFLAKKFQICKVVGGQEVVVAEAQKESSFASFSSYFNSSNGIHRYFLTIQPNVDAAFIVALCATIDEIFHDQKQ